MASAEMMAEVDHAPIVALQGASSAEIQEMLRDFAEHLAACGLRVAGVIESAADPTSPCKSMALVNLADGRTFSISQSLGPGSQACNLDPEGIVSACAIARGADVVILSKFGKQEAAGGGLSDAFGSAIAAGLPIITAVSPTMMSEWRSFAGDLAVCVAAHVARQPSWIETWRVVTAPHARDMIAPATGWIGTA